MPSTTDSATGTNKRRRANGSRANRRTTAPATAEAAAKPVAPNDPFQLLGTRLEPIMKVLASQPTSLQTHIITKTNVMLDLLATIRQRGESHTRFGKPMTDATSGAVLKDDEGKAKEFVPNSCRDKCPIKPSQQSNDDDDMKTLLEAANKDHEAWKTAMSNHAKNVSELEISIRNEKLRKLFYEFVKDLALTTVITHEITSGGFPAGNALTTPEITHVTAYSVLDTFSEDDASFIGFNDTMERTASNQLAQDYAKVMSFDVAATKNKAIVNRDGVIVLHAVEILKVLVPSLTTNLWKSIQDQERKSKINAAIKLALAPAAKKTATEEVEAALANLDVANPTKSLLDLIDKRTKAGLDKIKADMKRDLRKNYLAGSKNQELTPIKNGQRSKKASTAATSSKTKKKNATPKRPEKGTPRNNGGATPKQKKKKRGQRGHGSRGESNAEGHQRGAGRS